MIDMPHPPGCPACGSPKEPAFVEDWHDRFDGKDYKLHRCPDCAVVWSTPREPVGAEWYAKSAPIRHRETRPAPETDWRFNQFLSERLPPGRILDVGCGDGGFMQLMERRGWKATGFDYDERVAAQARAKGLDAHAMEFTQFIASRRPGEFDAASMFDVLEHTPEPSWFFKEVAKLVRPGGHVAINLPNALRPLPWVREEHDFPPHHYTRWTPEAMAGFLDRHGFDVVRQDAGTLKIRYLADHCFFYRVMPGLLGVAKRVLFGKQTASAGGPTISELYDKQGGAKAGVLGDKLRRQKIIDFARAGFQAAGLPVWLAMRAYYNAREPRSGDALYTLARKRP